MYKQITSGADEIFTLLSNEQGEIKSETRSLGMKVELKHNETSKEQERLLVRTDL
jgi:hypothetical protein